MVFWAVEQKREAFRPSKPPMTKSLPALPTTGANPTQGLANAPKLWHNSLLVRPLSHLRLCHRGEGSTEVFQRINDLADGRRRK